MDNLEKNLSKLKDDCAKVPDIVLDKVNLAFDEIRNTNIEVTVNKNNNTNCKNNKTTTKKKYRYHLTAAGLLIAVLISFSSPVKAALENLIFSFNNSGIENAVGNDYIQKISDTAISTDKFDISLENVLVDPYNIALDFKLLLKDTSILPKEFDSKSITTTISLSDENNTTISKYGDPGVFGYLAYDIDYSNLNNNILGVKVLFKSTDVELQDFSQLNITVQDINFNTIKGSTIFTQPLNWDLNINLDDKFVQSKSIDYTTSNSSSNINIKKVTSYPTGMFIDLDYLAPGHDENLLSHMKLIDENGAKYKISNASIGQLENGADTISGIFEGLTSFDNVSTFALEIENPDGLTIDRVEFTSK